MHRLSFALIMTLLASLAAYPVFAQGTGLLPLKSIDQEVGTAIAQAETAIRNCDEESYEEAIEWLDEIADDVDGDTGDDIDDEIDRLDGQWNNTFPCGLRPRDNPYALNIIGLMGRLHLTNGPAFLGRENGGVIRTLQFVRPESSGSFSGVGAEMRYTMGRLPNWANMANVANMGRTRRSGTWDFFAGFNQSRGVIDDNFRNIRTGGDILLIPGVGSGPNGAGFALAFGGGANTITRATYDSEYEWDRYWLGFGRTTSRNGVRLRTFGGIEYGRMDTHQRFGGSIPGFARDFQYNTSVTSDIYSPLVGVEAGYRPSFTLDLPVSAEVFGKATYKLGYNRADGHDSLAFTGFNTQTIDIDENKFTHNLGIETGVTINPDEPFNFTFSGGYQRMGNMPTVTRNGQGPSNLKFEDSNSWTLGVRGTLRF